MKNQKSPQTIYNPQIILAQFKTYLKTKNLSHLSIKNYLSDLRRFLTHLQQHSKLTSIHQLQAHHLKYHLQQLRKQGLSPTSLNRVIATFKHFGPFLEEVYHLPNPFQNLDHPGKTSPPHSTDNYIKHFTKYLKQEQLSSTTIKSYKSDVSRYLDWLKHQPFSTQSKRLITKSLIKKYLNYLTQSQNIKNSTLTRKAKSLTRFRTWFSTAYPSTISSDSNKSNDFRPKVERFLHWKRSSSDLQDDKSGYKSGYEPHVPTSHMSVRNLKLQYLPNIFFLTLIALFFTALGVFGYRQFAKQAIISKAYPSSPITPNRQLSFQGRLVDSTGTPITTATNMVFKLYDTETNGTELYSTGTCSITPDQDGVFSTQIGSDCGSAIPSSVFTENSDVWLEVTVGSETLTPRQQIATVAYALNAETIQGIPLSATMAAIRNTIVPMNQWGEVILGEQSPTLKSIAGTFQIQGAALTFSTATGTNGNIIFSPDGTGQIKLLSNTQTTDSLYIQNAQLTSGSLIKGYIGNDTTTGNLLTLSSGSTETNKFTVDTSGNTYMAGKVGINIASPTGMLSIVSNNAATPALLLESAASPTADYLQIRSNGSTAGDILTVDSSGRVGIGTTSPTQKLHIAGNLRLTGAFYDSSNSPGANNYVLTSTDTGTSWTDTSTGTLSPWTYNSPYLYPDHTTDRVGIGTTNTADMISQLYVTNGSTLGKALAIFNQAENQDIITASASGITKFRIDNNGYVHAQRFVDLASSSYYLDPAATDTSLTVAGKVGIGTTNPSYKLDVDGSGHFTDRLVVKRYDTNYSYTLLDQQLWNQITTDGTYYNRGVSGTVIKGVDSGVTDSGYAVGVWGEAFGGDSDHGHKLEGTLDRVVGGTFDYGIYGDSNTGQVNIARGIELIPYVQSGTINNLYDLYISAPINPNGNGTINDHYAIYQVDQNAKNYFAGNVGIGTTNPGTKLEVYDGEIKISNDANPATLRIWGDRSNVNDDGRIDAQIIMNTDNSSSYGIRLATHNYAGYNAFSIYDINQGNTLLWMEGNTGNVGIGTTSPSEKLEVSGNIKSTNGIYTSHHFEWSGKTANFPNNQSNQVAYIDLGDTKLWGWIEVTLTDAWSYQNTTGKYTKRYNIGRNEGSTSFNSNGSEVPVAFGPVANQWKLGEPEIDNNKHVRIPIYHLVSTGNAISVFIEGELYSTSTIKDLLSRITLTTPTTVSNSETRDYVHFLDSNVGIGTTSPPQKLTVAGYAAAQRFVDTASTSYYLDPAATDTSLNVAGTIRAPYLYPALGSGDPYRFIRFGDSSTYWAGFMWNNNSTGYGNGDDFVLYTYDNRDIFLDAGTGTVSVGASGGGKLDAGTIDPPYTIAGKKYATYLPGMTGVKEETTGTVYTSEYVPGEGYRYTIDFTNLTPDSDLWLFSEVTHLSQQLENLVVLLSPAGNTRAWYQLDAIHNKLYIYSSAPTYISYRLTAPRFDTDKWANTRDASSSSGFIINNPNHWQNNPNGSIIGQLTHTAKEIFTNLKTKLLSTNLITPEASSSPIIISNNSNQLSVISDQEITNDQPLLVVDGTITTATISARLTKLKEIQADKIKTNTIEADTIKANHIEGLDAKIATLSAQTVINQHYYATASAANLSDQELQRITQTIKDRLANLLNPTTAQDIPVPTGTPLSDSENPEASDSSALNTALESTPSTTTINPNNLPDTITIQPSLSADIATINNYLAVIGQATITNLDITDHLYTSTLASKTNTLEIQPLGGTVKLAANTLIIDSTTGTVEINGNLKVNGTLYAQKAQINQLHIGYEPIHNEATPSGSSKLRKLLAVYNEQGQEVASIDASGSANFNDLTTQIITIASSSEASNSATPSGILQNQIASNATAGQATLVSPNTKLTITSPYLDDNTLVYLTPTSNTFGQVLYVKSKHTCPTKNTANGERQTEHPKGTPSAEGGIWGCSPSFTVAIDSPVTQNITFNWWIIKLKNSPSHI